MVISAGIHEPALSILAKLTLLESKPGGLSAAATL
jgi:hypothetical protein